MQVKYPRSAQRTLREPVAYCGPAAGGQRRVTMLIAPAVPDTGIRFVRRDAPGGPQALRARIEYLGTDGSSATLECPGGIAVRAVGPILAALAACGIDNAEVALDGPEAALPDGGTPALVEAIGRGAVQDQARPLRVIRIERALDVEDGPRRAMLRPSNVPHAAISFGGENEHSAHRWLALGLGEEALRRELMNTAAGGDVRPTGTEALRRALLDCVGYLAVAGAPIVGHFLAQNPDHNLMRRLVHAFLGQRGSWSLVEVPAARA
ncbi:MAG TPA: UDP-3-O-acyl-N-acetylglucosamine deacetylase [Burkholderiales bacterium]|nr:UDP-3-O-acyl-N-acetylglucosamine deacetylase [Burkholderiales bacterium]